jgi:glycosyltransferase involved in cell wall biosynthesis
MTVRLSEADVATAPVDHAGDTAPRVIFLARDLVMGGAERAFVTYVNAAREVRPVAALLQRYGALLPELRSDVPSFDLSAGFPSKGRAADFLDNVPGWTVVRLAHECRALAALVRETGATTVSSFLMRAHLVALLTKRFYTPQLRVILNIHEHWSGSTPYLYPKWRDRWLMRWITRRLFPAADGIVTVASEVRRDLIEEYGLAPERIHVAFNPLEIDRITDEARSDLPPEIERFMSVATVVGVGRLVPLTGYDLLIRAVARLRSTMDVRLVLVGDGSERAPLEALAQRLGVGPSVYFAGWQANPWRFIARARALALTSFTEAFPCVLSESLALGVPVVATDCSAGVRELLQDGACGVIVPHSDADAIAGGLARVLTDEGARSRLAARGRRRVEEFRPSTAIPLYERILRDGSAAVAECPADAAHSVMRQPVSSIG